MIDPSKIIVALDFATSDEAVAMAEILAPTGVRFKIGMELYDACGPSIIADIRPFGEIFLDLKLHDIPETMARTAVVLTRQGVWMLNVHASAGLEAMRCVAERVSTEALQAGVKKPLMIAVTLLTSLNDFSHLGISEPANDSVLRLSQLAIQGGLDGVVCSSQEVPLLKSKIPGIVCVTPGIRREGDNTCDQKRTVTPAEALASGSDYLVIGRPITRAVDPLAELRNL